MASQLLTFAEVAERLRKTEAQLRWMKHQGTAPSFAMIGGRLMARESDVDSWIQEQFEAASA